MKRKIDLKEKGEKRERKRKNRTEDRSEEWKSISKYIRMPTRIL